MHEEQVTSSTMGDALDRDLKNGCATYTNKASACWPLAGTITCTIALLYPHLPVAALASRSAPDLLPIMG